jgi:hypothetical protein
MILKDFQHFINHLHHDFFCYGCDEGRNGYLIKIRRKLSIGIIIMEEACVGCMSLLDSIRLFSIPFAQVCSHEGLIIWAISPGDYYEHQSLVDNNKPFLPMFRKRDSHINRKYRQQMLLLKRTTH